MSKLPQSTALILIDVQQAFLDPRWGERNNRDAESNIAQLLSAWRKSGRPVRHVLHDSVEANSLLRPESPGNAIQAVATPKATEPVYRKHVNSAFIGTSLEKDLRHDEIDTLVLVGLTTNHLRFDFGPDGRQSRVHHFRGFRCDCGFRAGSVGWNGAFRGCCTFCGSQRSSPGIRNHC